MTALLLACALVLVLGAAQAQAAPKGVVGFFGSSGTGAGQFNTPRGVAVNQSTGDVYVVDSLNHRVQQFDASSTFVRTWGWGVQTGAAAFEVCTAPGPCLPGITGAGAGQLATPQGIAVDQASGSVYVTNQNNRRIEKFDSSGNFLFAFGWGVDTGAAAVETCTTASTCQAAVTGPNAGQFATNFSGHVAVDQRNGDVVAADPGNRRVQKFDSSGAFLSAFGWGVDTGAAALETCTTASSCQAGLAGSGAGQFSSNQPTRVAVDSTGSVYTVESTGNFRVQRFTPTATVGGVFAAGEASGTSAATAPFDVAVDPANDNVLVTKADNSSGPTERRVLELNLGGSLVDTHAAGAGLPTTNGLALRSSTGRIYLSTSTNQRLFILGPITPPSVTIAPVTDITATSATLNGTVNPNGSGLSTGYHFEYSDDGGATWTRVPTSDVDVGNGTADVPVSQPVTGLEPNTEYRVRLVASRPFAGGSATSATIPDNEGNPVPVTFRTDAAPPAISEVGSREVTDTTALLAGRIDPNRSHTTYRFEYGTDTSYGSATAVDNAGSGATPVPVSKAVTDLQPGTTYHFRLVATNAADETTGADQTFTTAANPPQPSGRAYEMVSPLDKNGGGVNRDNVFGLSLQSGAAASGDAAAFVSLSQFGDIESAPIALTYVARREDTGWRTESVTPPISDETPNAQADGPAVNGLSLDLSKAFVKASPELVPGAERLGGSRGLYMRRTGAAEPYTLLSFPWTSLRADSQNPFEFGRRFNYVADTPDSRHVVFNAERQLLPGAPEEPQAPAPLPGQPTWVYEWIDGSLRLVSVPPPDVQSFDVSSSSGSRAAVVAGAIDRRNNADLPGDHVISDDGRRVFFTALVPGGSRHLFVRQDGTTTVHVSRSELPGDPYTGAEALFWAAKGSDGSVAFFSAGAPLTEGAGTNALYRWDANAQEGARLTVIRSGVTGVAAVNDDATSVAFAADGELYLWRQAEGVRQIAKLDTTLVGPAVRDARMWVAASDLGGRAARISADGERVLFASFAKQPDLPYDITEETPEACGNLATGGERCRQIYLYDASRDELSCLTCVPGVPVTGNADLFGRSEQRPGEQPAIAAPYRQPRNLSADGARAFFETARPLVSGDGNTKLDVYEWEDRDLDGQGELRLISPGRGTTDSKFVDASLSGDDVFFTTREQLVGIDRDNQVDLYDARVGGGIAVQNPPPVSQCQGEECQGGLSGPPSLPGVGSGGASNGNASPGPRPSFSVARLSRDQLARLARGRPVALRVRVNRPGSVRLSAHAKVGKRMRTVAGASKRAGKAGAVSLSLKLSRSARRELARKSRLNVRLAVRFAGVREARTSTLRLRRARSSGERRAR